MKEFKNDSNSVLSRFGRDKRQHTVKVSAERVERRPRLQRDAADKEQPSKDNERKSYNPNFTRDNRPTFDKDSNRSYEKKPYSDRNSNQRQEGDRRPYGERSEGNRSYEKKPYGDRERKPFEGNRSFGDKKYGDKKFGDKKFGDKKFGDKKFGDKKYGDRKFDNKSGKPAFRKEGDKPAFYPKFNPEKQVGEIRLNRFIAQSGHGSRREADEFITAGLVTVNGVVITELGTKVMPTDEVKFNNERIEGEKKVYLVLNKPKGYVTSLDDPHADKTVMELVKGACEERIYPVGRLDKNSLGLLLFTNDGDLTRQLTHPSYMKKKVYQVTLDKPLERADMERIASGIALEDGDIFADEIAYVKEDRKEIGIEIHSGRNRIVRRIFEFLGYSVTKLDRVYYAGLTKKNLKRGAWRFLTREEVERLKSGQYE